MAPGLPDSKSATPETLLFETEIPRCFSHCCWSIDHRRIERDICREKLRIAPVSLSTATVYRYDTRIVN
jgi:hypothetical protein